VLQKRSILRCRQCLRALLGQHRLLHRLLLHGERDWHSDCEGDDYQGGYDDDHEGHVSVVYVYRLLDISVLLLVLHRRRYRFRRDLLERDYDDYGDGVRHESS
jgi:hypothetical protein